MSKILFCLLNVPPFYQWCGVFWAPGEMTAFRSKFICVYLHFAFQDCQMGFFIASTQPYQRPIPEKNFVFRPDINFGYRSNSIGRKKLKNRFYKNKNPDEKLCFRFIVFVICRRYSGTSITERRLSK